MHHHHRSTTILLSAFIGALCLLQSTPASADKLRDLTEIVGARDNQLLGYGVVTGLSGTGDDASAPLAMQSMLSMLRRLGVQSSQKQIRLRNVAAVMVTATIPPFAKAGTKLDITVSSLGNAKSLQGGVLVQTLLKGADRKTYAVAQGSLVIGGFSAKGNSGSKVSSGSSTTGRIPQGAIVEREIPSKFFFKGVMKLSLRRPSFTMASRIAQQIESELGKDTAMPQDAGVVVVTVPSKYTKRPVDLIAMLEAVEVKVERQARVIVNERTHTIVAGGDVRLAPVAIVHGGLTIVVKEKPKVSQAAPLAKKGQTVTTPDSKVDVLESTSTMQYLDGATTLSDLASALGTLGLSARELISVLQALREAGSLEAELVVQ